MSNPFEEAFDTWWADHGSTMKRGIYEDALEFHKRLAAKSWIKAAEHAVNEIEKGNI